MVSLLNKTLQRTPDAGFRDCRPMKTPPPASIVVLSWIVEEKTSTSALPVGASESFSIYRPPPFDDVRAVVLLLKTSACCRVTLANGVVVWSKFGWLFACR